MSVIRAYSRVAGTLRALLDELSMSAEHTLALEKGERAPTEPLPV